MSDEHGPDNAEPLGEPRGFCEAMSPDGTVRCSLSKGHKSPAIDGDGETYDHAAPSFGVWWNEPPRCPATTLATVRCVHSAGHEPIARDPQATERFDHAHPAADTWWHDVDTDPIEAPLLCESRPEPFGWATRDTRCLKPRGHEGEHRAGQLAWSVGADPINDPSSWIGKAFGGLGGPEIPRMFANDVVRPPAVRVRFVDLPNRHTAMAGPMGSPMHIAEPGGFALVLDRFRDRAHCDGERANWDGFGSMIGAHVVLCYPGDLDIVGWFDNV